MALKTDYKDDVPVSERRKYQMVDNGDGTVSFVDVTEYLQEGDAFGAADINATNEAVNNQAQRPIDNNLLINSNFMNPVNQRGLTEYINGDEAYGFNGYTIDRWESYETEVIVRENGIGIYGGNNIASFTNFHQKIEIRSEYLLGKKIAVSFETDKGTFGFVAEFPTTISEDAYDLGSLYINEHDVKVVLSYDNYYYDVGCLILDFRSYSDVETILKWAKVEINDVATPYIPRTYAEEFTLCQYYYQVFNSNAKTAHVSDSKSAVFIIQCPSKMRVKNPTNALQDGWKVFPNNRNGSEQYVSGLTVVNFDANTFQNKAFIRLSGTSLPFGDTNKPYLDAVITMDAEI